jgi:putative NADH-flavin reductase
LDEQVLADLHKHGHEVTALVRDDAQADNVAARGARPVVVDLYDRPTVARLLGRADWAIHTASPGDATSANLDSAVVDAVIDAFAGTGKPYLQISGLWIYGANTSITEESASRRRPVLRITVPSTLDSGATHRWRPGRSPSWPTSPPSWVTVHGGD